MNAAVSPQSVNPAALLLELGHRARAATSTAELGFLMVNDSRLLASYRQSALWLETDGLVALSGVVEPDKNTPYAQWLLPVCNFLQAQDPAEPRAVTPADLDPALAKSWHEWLGTHAVWIPLPGKAGDARPAGGVLFSGPQAFEPQHLLLLTEWGRIWAHAYRALQTARPRFTGWLPARSANGQPWWRRKAAWIAGAVIIVALVPVRMTVLAPGELVAARPIVLRSPLDGVIDQIHVQPNQMVRKGQPLFGLDEAQIDSRREVAQQALLTAEAEYRQSAQMALGDARSKAQLATLVGRIGEKRAELSFLADQQTRARVLAPEDGMVLFDSPTDWIGKPVQTGERVMRIARPDEVEIEAWLPVGDAIALEQESPVRLYLASAPTTAQTGKLRYLAYDASARPDGSYAYRLRATVDSTKNARIGLKGTAKLQGDRVPLFYWILRKPWAVVRQFIAW